MTANRILDGLEAVEAKGAEAEAAARLGFLEWAFLDRDGGTPLAARQALSQPAAQNARSDAALAFVDYLREAARVMSMARPVRRGRMRRLH